jgi:hypothetical protein
MTSICDIKNNPWNWEKGSISVNKNVDIKFSVHDA